MSRRRQKSCGAETILLIISIPFLLIEGAIKLLAMICRSIANAIQRKKQKNKSEYYQDEVVEDVTEAPKYKRKMLLTKHEWAFYQSLKPIADKLGLVVLSKIRMADLVEPVADNNSTYYQAFGKVKAKHVDFALARPENLYVELLIELDDSTHEPGNERDAFVESVYATVGYRLLRVWSDVDLEMSIREALGIKIIASQDPSEEDWKSCVG